MSLVNDFKKLPWIVKIILMIPGISWITEIVVRVSAALHGKGIQQILVVILVIIFGGIIGIIDLFVVIFTGKMILT